MTQKPRFSSILEEIPSPQERVNQEMFRAIELLGRKLQRAESERADFNEVLTQIEQAATRDETTGRLYLPAVIEQPAAPPRAGGWQTPLALTSSVIALVAVLVALHRPPVQQLNPAQLAALDAFIAQQAALDTAKDMDVAQLTNMPPPPVPADAQLAEHPDEVAAIEQDLSPAELSAIEPASGDATAEIPALDAAAPLQPATVAANDATPPSSGKVSGISPDTHLPHAVASLESRAFAGVAGAQHDLAALYVAGKEGVAQDYGRALFWFTKAAESGVPNAQYNLGVMHQQGLGVEKDEKTAIGWYEKAAQLGHPQAMYNLGIAYVDGAGADKNVARGIAFFKQAANAGVAQAAYNLGALYESNVAGAADLDKAEEWYQTAANEGHAGAQQALARLSGPEAGYGQGDETTAADETAADEARQEKTGLSVSDAQGEVLVKRIQQALVTRGELPAALETGEMNQQTENAIRSWQQTLGWDQSGEPSRELLQKIEGSVRP